jgi:hypothetical protein
MSTDLDTRLRELFTELADATPVETPTRFHPELIATAGMARDLTHRSKWLAVVGVAAAIALIVGLVAMVRHDDARNLSPSNPTATTRAIPPTDPVLWAPDTSSGAITIAEYQQATSAPLHGGAVRSSDGTVFGISVNPDFGDTPTTGDERTIGGHTVRASTDGTAPGEVYRTTTIGCINVGLTTAGEDTWSDDALALLNGLTASDGSIRIELPPGWSTLGQAVAGRQFEVSFDVTVNGRQQTVSMWQMPSAPAGFYLTAMESNPRAVQIGGAQGWVVDGVTTAGYTTLVAERDGTAFVVGGLIPVDQLIKITRAMVRAPQSDWTAHQDRSVTNITPAPAPPGCQLPALDIVAKP